MPVLAQVNSLFRNFLRKPRIEKDLDDEINAHLDLLTDQKINEGMNPQDARRAARIELGGVEQIKENVRAVRAGVLLETLWQDLGFGLRMLRKSPGFTAVAVLTLALGIGANTAMFSVVNAVLLRPLPYSNADHIVQLVFSSPQGGQGTLLSVPEFMSFRALTDVFQDVAAEDFGGPGVNLTEGDRPEQVKGIHVSADYFRLFGAQAEAGRTFSADEDRPGGAQVVVISNALWRNRFNADTGLVGKPISLGGEPYIVVGVLEPDFDPDPAADLWLPLQADPSSRSPANYIRVAARLKPGVTLDRAKEQLKLAAVEFGRSFPLFNTAATFSAWPLRDTVVGDVSKPLFILFGTVSFVLLIDCANVANLLLARATGRQREMAIRGAMGASRARLVSQSLTESALLAVGGGLLGSAIGYLGMRALLAINPGNIPRIGAHGSAVTLDWRVLAFTVVVSVGTGIVFGLLPAVSASHANLSVTMREGSSRSGSGLHESHAGSIFVVVEVALAVVLVFGATLLIRTFAALRSVKPGFDSHNVLTLDMSLTGTRFQETIGVIQVVREAERRVGSLPGVAAVASSWMLPIESAFSSSFILDGRPLASGQVHGLALMRPVSPQYFSVFRIPLLRGRLFTDRDEPATPGVVLISEGMAKEFWHDGNPIGERLTIDKYLPGFAAPPRQIIGIVGDVRNVGIDREPDPIIYMPQTQVTDGMTAVDTRVIPITWAIRTSVEPNSLSLVVQEELRKASGGLPVAHIRSMEQVLGQSLARSDFNAVLLTIFAGTALLSSAIGIYGLMAYSMQQRTQEIGIRMALGARWPSVLKMILGEGMKLALIGVCAGIVGALSLTRLLRTMLYGVAPTDPIAFLSAIFLLLGVALLACYIPARRATKVDPMVALRHE